jgi:CubicO group peptidase (beta-lactamase class C family)
VVLLNGEIVYEFYDHDMGPRTPHILMSASKSVIGLAAGILHHSGLLDLDAPVSDLVPEIVGSAYRRATVRQLLDMRTGVVLDEQDVIAYEAASNWSPPPPGREGANLHDFLRNLTTPAQPHGGPFRYISGNIDLLGWVIERATGQTVAEVVSERLWRPMGAQDDAFITLDRAGAPRCTGGVCATARDFARIGQLIVQGGRRGDRRIIPEAWIDDIVENGDRQAWKAGEFSAGFAGMTMAYRGGWYVIDDAPKMIFAMGIHGQNLFVDRAHGLVIAKLSSQADRIGYRAVALTHRAAPEILRCLML